MSENMESVSSGDNRLIFACSGGSDMGQLADLAGRRLTVAGLGILCCTAGVGGRVKVLMEKTEAAEEIITIDGCPHDCAKKTLELAGFDAGKHVRVSDFGFEKGKSPATEENILNVVEKAKIALA
jgi:uncharacterized metal-binding protein